MNWISTLLGNLNYGTILLLMLLESTVIPVPSELVVAPAAYHAFPSREYIIHSGDSGQLVYIIQAMLNGMGKAYDNMPDLTVCGTFNNATADAVRLFQKKSGLDENGNVDCHTWNMLVHCCESINDK